MAVKMSAVLNGDTVHFREVWNDNLEEKFGLIRRIVDDYPYIAMDTEFPGVVLRPIGNFKNNTEFTFRSLKANVDLLKLIQLGLTFTDKNGAHNHMLAPGEITYSENSICCLAWVEMEVQNCTSSGVTDGD
ncbi:ccr4 associated factor [Ancistrocladus abbreviatus]